MACSPWGFLPYIRHILVGCECDISLQANKGQVSNLKRFQMATPLSCFKSIVSASFLLGLHVRTNRKETSARVSFWLTTLCHSSVRCKRPEAPCGFAYFQLRRTISLGSSVSMFLEGKKSWSQNYCTLYLYKCGITSLTHNLHQTANKFQSEVLSVPWIWSAKEVSLNLDVGDIPNFLA